MSTKRKFTIGGLATLVLVLMMVIPWTVFASSVDESIVDTTAPTGSVTLAPGGSGSITINLSVTGNQVGTATFEVNRDWTLSGGTFTGSNPQTFTVPPRAATDAATTLSASGTVSVDSGQADGNFPLAVGAINITNTNTTGAKLAAGGSSSYSVTVLTPTPSDTTPPVIGYVLTPSSPDGSNGWYQSNVKLTWTVTENESPSSLSKTGCVDQNITADQTATTYSCSATSDGGSAGPVDVTIKRDATNPVITDLGATTSADGANGWYVSAVSNQFRASDATSGFSAESNPYDFTVSSGAVEGSAVKVNSGSVIDAAGNTNPGIESAAFKIDLSDPTNVAFVGGGISDGGSYFFGFVPAAPTCTADDAISGLASCVVTGYSTAVGAHTLTATATDNAGRTATATLSYSVLNWTLSGFYQPVDMNGVLNTVKNGATVPLKFEVFAGSTELVNTSVVTSLKSAKVNCDGTAPTDDVELTATGGTSLRYDTTAGQFVYNWQTPKTAGVCYNVTVTMQDGSALTALFKLK